MRRQEVIQSLRSILLLRRQAIRESLDLARAQLRTRSEHDVGDHADAALDAEHDEISSQLAEVESRELANIENALEKIREGSYGACERCNTNIPLARGRRTACDRALSP